MTTNSFTQIAYYRVIGYRVIVISGDGISDGINQQCPSGLNDTSGGANLGAVLSPRSGS